MICVKETDPVGIPVAIANMVIAKTEIMVYPRSGYRERPKKDEWMIARLRKIFRIPQLTRNRFPPVSRAMAMQEEGRSPMKQQPGGPLRNRQAAHRLQN